MAFNYKIAVFILGSLPFFNSMPAQTLISGTVRDSLSGQPAMFVQLVLFRYQSEVVIASTLTDEQGKYELYVKPGDGAAFTLSTRSITYLEESLHILLDLNNVPKSLEVNLPLIPKTHLLEEAQVTARRAPFVLAKDTIVYQTEPWTAETDQNLEEVLRKIPGFEILPGGTVKVNGKTVQKVLLNGEEISDGGTSLLTQNLGPDRVQSVEIRFDEQNHRIRESILATSDFVVMNIKLKPDFDPSLFGRIFANTGYGKELQPGGAAKLFSLRAKTKLQLLAEREAFGKKTIFLEQVQNLGAQAIQQLQEVSADFNSIRDNPEFHRELYGFDDFVHTRSAAAGITGKLSISPSFDLFVGTFNHLDDIRQHHLLRQAWLSTPPQSTIFDIRQSAFSGFSRNKVEATLSIKDLKISYNFNNRLSIARQERLQEENTGSRYNFRHHLRTYMGYHNLFFEKKYSDQIGLQVNMGYQSGFDRDNRQFQHNNTRLAAFFLNDSNRGIPQTLEQRIPSQNQLWQTRAMVQSRGKMGVWQLGARISVQGLTLKKQFFEIQDFTPSFVDSDFSTDSIRSAQIQLQPFLEYQRTIGAFQWNNRVGLMVQQSKVPNHAFPLNSTLVEYSSSLTISLPDGGNALFSITQNAASFPLSRLLPGFEIIDFQSVIIPGRFWLRPQPEQVIRFSGTTFAWAHRGIALEFAGIRGFSRSGPTLDFLPEGVIARYFDQLPARYVMAVGKLAKVFEGMPIQAKIESSLIGHIQYNRKSGLSDDLIATRTRISQLDFRLFTAFQEKPFQMEMRLKYGGFNFTAEGLDNTFRHQSVRNIFFKYQQRFFQKGIWLETQARHTAFSGIRPSGLWLMDITLNRITPGRRWSFHINNIWNARSFQTQELSPVLFSSLDRMVFGRNVRLQFAWNIH